jgi:hypothetical protein
MGNWLAYDQLFAEPSAFNSSLVSGMFSGMAAGNAKIVRIFLFPALQGICIEADTSGSWPAPGLAREFLRNLKKVFSLARKSNFKLYITALDANDAYVANSNNYPVLFTYYKNLFSNNGGATTAYENFVLGPVLRLMSLNQDVIYGFDLIDEIEAAINAGYFSDYWIGAQAWIRDMTAFVNSKSPWLPDVNRRLWLRCPRSHPRTLFGARPKFLRCGYIFRLGHVFRSNRAMLQNEVR